MTNDSPAALRALLARPGSERESYTDSQLREFAQGTITTLERHHQDALVRWRQVAEVESSLPHPDTAQRLGRYEVLRHTGCHSDPGAAWHGPRPAGGSGAPGAQLNRQIHRSLRTLRELQALRAKGRRLHAPSPDDGHDPPTVL